MQHFLEPLWLFMIVHIGSLPLAIIFDECDALTDKTHSGFADNSEPMTSPVVNAY